MMVIVFGSLYTFWTVSLLASRIYLKFRRILMVFSRILLAFESFTAIISKNLFGGMNV